MVVSGLPSVQPPFSAEYYDGDTLFLMYRHKDGVQSKKLGGSEEEESGHDESSLEKVSMLLKSASRAWLPPLLGVYLSFDELYIMF